MHHISPEQDRSPPPLVGLCTVTFERASTPIPRPRVVSPRDSHTLGNAASAITVTRTPVIITATRTSTSSRPRSSLPTQTVTITHPRTTSTTIPPPTLTTASIITGFTTLPPSTLALPRILPIISPSRGQTPSRTPSPSPSPTSTPTPAPVAAGFGAGVPLFVLLSLAAWWYLWYVRRGKETPIKKYWRKRAIRKKERKEGMKSYKERQKDGNGGKGSGFRERESVLLGRNIIGLIGLSRPEVPPPPRAGRDPNGTPRPGLPQGPQNGAAGPSRPRPPPADNIASSVGQIRIPPPPFPHQSWTHLPPLPPPPPPPRRCSPDGPIIPPQHPYQSTPPIPRTTSWDSITTATSAKQMELVWPQTPPPILPPLTFLEGGTGAWKWEVRGGDEVDDDGGKGKQGEWYGAL